MPLALLYIFSSIVHAWKHILGGGVGVLLIFWLSILSYLHSITIFRYFCNGYCPTYNALMTSSQDSPKSSKSSRVLNINSRIISPGANTAAQWRDPQINSQSLLKWGKNIKAFKPSHYRGRNCRSAQAYCLSSVIGRAGSTVFGHLHMCGSLKIKFKTWNILLPCLQNITEYTMRSDTYWTTSLAVNNPNFSLHTSLSFTRQDHSLHLRYQNVDFILMTPSLLLTLKSVHRCYQHTY